MPTYSFQDVHASIDGTGGGFSLSDGEGAAEEAITVEPVEDKNIMTTGADGGVMHALVASKSGTATIRLLQTNPLNARLQNMYNLQTQSATTHGKNVITIRDVARGDTTTISEAAFKRQPTLNYGKNGDTKEWAFDCGKIDTQLGFGAPEVQ